MPRKKNIKPPTPERLKNIALYYLSRYAASESSLRRVLTNRIRRAKMAHADFAADEATQAIEAIIAAHKKTGGLNDEAYAEMKVNALRRTGHSARRIALRLKQKGIAPNIIETALRPEEEGKGEDIEATDSERKAALTYAKRKGLGPYRKPRPQLRRNEDRRYCEQDQARKEMAAMARAGFSYDTIRVILGKEGLPEDDDF